MSFLVSRFRIQRWLSGQYFVCLFRIFMTSWHFIYLMCFSPLQSSLGCITCPVLDRWDTLQDGLFVLLTLTHLILKISRQKRMSQAHLPFPVSALGSSLCKELWFWHVVLLTARAIGIGGFSLGASIKSHSFWFQNRQGEQARIKFALLCLDS